MQRPPTSATLIACAAALALCAGAVRAHDDGGVGHFGTHNVKPRFISSAISSAYYGAGDCTVAGAWCEAGNDLLTGGLSASGLLLAAPLFANPLAPTAAELRRNAIHVNYRAVLDILPSGGYGTLTAPTSATTVSSARARARSPAGSTSRTRATAT